MGNRVEHGKNQHLVGGGWGHLLVDAAVIAAEEKYNISVASHYWRGVADSLHSSKYMSELRAGNNLGGGRFRGEEQGSIERLGWHVVGLGWGRVRLDGMVLGRGKGCSVAWLGLAWWCVMWCGVV